MSNPALPIDARLAHLEAKIGGVSERQVAFLQAMVRCRTISSVSPGAEFAPQVRACLDLIEAELIALGFTCERWDAGRRFPCLSAHRESAGARTTIGFNGHVDVVPVEHPAKWTHDPWEGEHVNNLVFGRGTCDAKGSVAALIGALWLLDAADLSPVCHLLLHIVSDEEVAGPCTDEALDRARPDAVMIGEPSNLDVWVAEPGLEHVRIVIDGRATHALNRWRALPSGGASDLGGVNAIEKALIVIQAIQELEREWTTRRRYPLLPAGFNTMNLGVITGGKSGGREEVNVEAGPGSVPDQCTLEYNIWYYPGERLADIRAEVEARVLEASQRDPWLRMHRPRFTWALRGLSNLPAETDPGHVVVQVLQAAAQRLKLDAAVTAMQGASLLPWYTRRGIPGVIFGPGNVAQAHSTDEFVDLASLKDTTLALALALADDRLEPLVSPGQRSVTSSLPLERGKPR